MLSLYFKINRQFFKSSTRIQTKEEMSSRKKMIEVIVSGLSPESYQKKKEKESL